MNKIKFGQIAELRKERFNPNVENDNRKCIELEHIEQNSGRILGYINSNEQKSIKNVFYKEDILFSKLRPYLRKYWLAEFDGVCSSEIWVLKPKNEINKEYLFNLLQTEKFIKEANVSSGTKMPRADWNHIVNCSFFIVHSLFEQKSIADCLSTWDAGIEKLTQLIQAKKQQKKGLMQRLFNGQLTIDNEQLTMYNVQLKRVENEEERLKGWKEVRLGDVSEIIKGKQLNRKKLTDTGKYPSYSGGITPSGYTDKSNWKANTITISEGGNSCGFVNYITTDFWLGGHCYAIEENENINQIFLYNYLKHKQSRIMILRVGSGLPNIQKGDLIKFKVNLPSLKEQTAIAEVLQTADQEIELLEQKLAAFQQQKKGLMQILLTGKKRLV